MKTQTPRRGFSMIEVLVGIFLVAVAVLGLAQLFLLAVANNRNADRIANATFLGQQQIDWLRGFTQDELAAYAGTSLESRDEVIDLNVDGTNDFRRITEFHSIGQTFQVIVHVYSAETIGVGSAAEILAEPEKYRARALLSTIITR